MNKEDKMETCGKCGKETEDLHHGFCELCTLKSDLEEVLAEESDAASRVSLLEQQIAEME